MSDIVLFGAGSAGKYCLRHLRARGIEPRAVADNDKRKVGTNFDGITVTEPDWAADFTEDCEWVCAAISRPAASEIRAELKAMGVKTKPLWECLPVCHGLPSPKVFRELIELCADAESVLELQSQFAFRSHPNYDEQRDPSPISELYFPDFIAKKDNEVYCDCGAADADSIKAFVARWPKYEHIVAIEPDAENMEKLIAACDGLRVLPVSAAAGDFDGEATFISTGDYSAHLSAAQSRDAGPGKTTVVAVKKLDSIFQGTPHKPTFIKADVEGGELELLWGARKLIREHSPVLAICAYHQSSHLWEIPMLLHAIQPEYKIFIRRYAEGAFELVYYAVPPERVLSDFKPGTSYSDDHVG